MLLNSKIEHVHFAIKLIKVGKGGRDSLFSETQTKKLMARGSMRDTVRGQIKGKRFVLANNSCKPIGYEAPTQHQTQL